MICLIFTGCATALKVFGKESVSGNEQIVTIPFEYNDLPIVQVEINSKTYRFLVDTGAPTIISSAILADLNIKKSKDYQMGDSQGVKKNQQFVVVPEIKLGSLTYRNVGAVVNDLDTAFEIECMGYDGILGANQMAVSVWKFDYQKKEIQIANSLEAFDASDFETIGFHPKKPQMTPLFDVTINDQKTEFTYDTGFTGGVTINESEHLDNFEKVTISGVLSAGIFGAGKAQERSIYKVKQIDLGGIQLEDIVIRNGNSNLIGNELIDNYISIIDWKTNKIYWKEVAPNDNSDYKTFGFAYRLNTLKAIVAYTIPEIDLPIKIGDTILSINNTSLQNLNKLSACRLTNNKVEEKLDSITVQYLKNGQKMEFQVNRKRLLRN